MQNKKRAVLFSLYLLPFIFNIALMDFLIPIKYDVILNNLPLIGLLITLAWLASSFLDFAVGDLTDKLGIRKTIQLGVLASFVGALVFAFSQNFLVMTIGIFIWGLSYIMLTIPSETYLLSKFPKNYRGSAYGIFYFVYDLAYAVAPLIGLVAFMFFGINTAIIAVAIIALFTIPLVLNIHKKKKENILASIEKVIIKDGIVKKELKDIKKLNPREFSLLFNLFICGLWFMTIMIGAPLLFFHGEHDLIKGALLTFSFMIPFAIMELFFGKLSNSIKKRKIMINLGFIISVVLLVIFFFTKSFIVMLLLATLITFATNMAWVATEVHLSEYLPKSKGGEFVGIFLTGKDVGFDLAPLFYGLTASLGLKMPFLIIGILLFVAWLFFIIANKNHKF